MRKKIVFLGASNNIQRAIDVAELAGFETIGIIDDNYYNRMTHISGLPVIGTEKNTNDFALGPEVSFFICSPMTSGSTPEEKKCNDRRIFLISLCEKLQLPMANLIHPTAIVPKTTKLGKGIFIDAYTVLQNHVTIEDYSFVKELVCIAHHTTIGFNVNISTQCYVGSHIDINGHCFIGIKNSIISSSGGLTIGEGTVTHPGIIIMRDLPPYSVAELGTGRLRKTFPHATISPEDNGS